MAAIIPFNAVRYNQETVADLSRVICPPYDIIPPERQKFFHELSPYNLIHMELGLDVCGEDKYERAGNHFRDLLARKVLIRDEKPAVYFYRQEYSINREKHSRSGFLALLRLEERKSGVFGHEHTHLEPKEDRLRLIRKVKANLSPIFVIFADRKKAIAQTLVPALEGTSSRIDIIDDEKVGHTLWRIDDPGILEKVQAKMEQENIFIADGHHRYEVACAYRDEMKQSLGADFTGSEGFNYVLAYFTNIDAQGLTVLPIHRLVRLAAKPDMDSITRLLAGQFSVEEVKDRSRFFFLLAKAGVAEHSIGMCADARCWLLRLRNVKFLDKVMADKPAEYRALDVAILNSLILKDVLKIDPADKDSVTFSAQSEDLLSACAHDPAKVAFFLNPTKVDQVMAIALRGEKMPPKSTYFYPKVASGLVIHKHE